MKLIRYQNLLLTYPLIFLQFLLMTSCDKKSHKSEEDMKIGFSGFYLDMDYLKVKSVMDSLLKTGELYYFETADILGNTQENLYYDFSGISSSLCAKVNLRGSLIVDQRLNSIQLSLYTRSGHSDHKFSYNVAMEEINRLFDLYKEKYGKPTLLGAGEKYNWLEMKLPNVYLSGPEGRLALDRIFFWEEGNYIIYFDFGYPVAPLSQGNPVAGSSVSESSDSTSTPVIYFDFTQDYLDRLLEKAGKIEGKESKL